MVVVSHGGWFNVVVGLHDCGLFTWLWFHMFVSLHDCGGWFA